MRRRVRAWVMKSSLRSLGAKHSWAVAWLDKGEARFNRVPVTLTYDDGRPAKKARKRNA